MDDRAQLHADRREQIDRRFQIPLARLGPHKECQDHLDGIFREDRHAQGGLQTARGGHDNRHAHAGRQSHVRGHIGMGNQLGFLGHVQDPLRLLRRPDPARQTHVRRELELAPDIAERFQVGAGDERGTTLQHPVVAPRQPRFRVIPAERLADAGQRTVPSPFQSRARC